MKTATKIAVLKSKKKQLGDPVLLARRVIMTLVVITLLQYFFLLSEWGVGSYLLQGIIMSGAYLFSYFILPKNPVFGILFCFGVFLLFQIATLLLFPEQLFHGIIFRLFVTIGLIYSLVIIFRAHFIQKEINALEKESE